VHLCPTEDQRVILERLQVPERIGVLLVSQVWPLKHRRVAVPFA
jgi:hypothetical protein